VRLFASCDISFETTVPVPVILMLRPRSGWGQWISQEQYSISPRGPVVEFTDIFGNLSQRVVIQPGTTTLRASCIAETPEEVAVDIYAQYIRPENLPENVLHFLYPSRYCPSDQLSALALEIVQNAAPGYPQVEAIRAWILANVRYSYGVSDTQTTALDTERSRAGCCRDFAHLGIALCRAINIPARMVAGYALHLTTPDIHAWFEAFVGFRWFTFDATSARTEGNRIAIGFGRDATDVAFVTQYGPLALTNLAVCVKPATD
jgi:transglutaminase-like putative cysteine protease